MASFPGSKVHRVSRRKLGRGQAIDRGATTVAVTSATDTATLTFAQPVIVSGVIPMNVSGGLTLVAQTVVSPTVVTQQFSGNVAAKTYAIDGASAPVATFQGGGLASASGTF